MNAFKSQGVTAKVDVTHLRASATVSIGKAQKMFGTKWAVYKTSTGVSRRAAGEHAEAAEGAEGQRRHVAGMRLTVKHGSSSGTGSAARGPVARSAGGPAYDGGTPTRTGTWARRASARPIPARSPRPRACSRTRS